MRQVIFNRFLHPNRFVRSAEKQMEQILSIVWYLSKTGGAAALPAPLVPLDLQKD